MDFKLDSLSPARKKILLAAAILLIIALVIVGIVRLTGSSTSQTSAASGVQSNADDQSAAPQSIAKTITPQSAGPANTTGSMDTGCRGWRTGLLRHEHPVGRIRRPRTGPGHRPVLRPNRLCAGRVRRRPSSGRGTERTPPAPTLEDVHILSDDGAGNITVSACVDSSSVRILNDAGTALTDDTSMTRALTYFQFVKDGENWKLADLSFPDDPTC